MNEDELHAENVVKGFNRRQLLDAIKERLPANHRDAVDVLGKVNTVYVESGRDKVITDIFHKYLGWLLAPQRHGRDGKGQAYYITGESGAGKTDAVEHLLETDPAMAELSGPFGPFRPFVSVKLQGAATLRAVGSTLLRQAGYGARRDARESKIWETLAADLVARHVLVVHIDEPQHLIKSQADIKPVANALKSLVNHVPPVGLILSGMPEINTILQVDEQSERRQFSVELTNVVPASHRFLIVRIIEQLCKAAELQCEAFVGSDMPERLAHAANYQFGRICEVTITGIHQAVLMGDDELTRDHLARAYRDHSHTTGQNDMNPFLADDWTSLDPGYYISGEGLDDR